VDDCTEIVFSVKHGVCHGHHHRMRRTGETGGVIRHRVVGNDAARLWSYVDVRGPSECHPWTGAATGGRGYFGVGGKTWRATRYLLGVIDGVDIEGLDVCHTCDNPNCMNRRHLFPGTRMDNVQDMITKGRRAYGGAKVTPELVLAARQLSDAGGHTPAELARIFKVNYHTMYDIVMRVTWKHVC
jgi:hypothetical protein